MYSWHRYFWPMHGVFPQMDPIGLAGGLSRPGYVGGNPLSFIDPLGLVGESPVIPIEWGPALVEPRARYGDICPPGQGAAKGVTPSIKAGAAGGATAGKTFPQAIKNAAKAENPLSTCVYCRLEGTATQVDHAIPKARGGNATLDNAQLACPHCNASKGARDVPVNPPPGYRGEWPPSHW